jgi:hypothetical protein
LPKKPLAAAVSGISRRPLPAQLGEAAGQCRETEQLHALRRVVPGLEHFGGGDAFGKAQVLLDDQRAAQRHREDDAEDAAQPGDGKYP